MSDFSEIRKLYGILPESLLDDEEILSIHVGYLEAENERLKAGYSAAIVELEDSPHDTERHRAVLDGVVESLEQYDDYLIAQLDGAHS